WLEPLARNTATSTPGTSPPVMPPPPPHSVTTPFAVPVTPPPAPPVAAILVQPASSGQLEVTELEDTKVAVPSESYNFDSKAETEPIAIKQPEAPNFGASLFESNEDVPVDPEPGSKKGLWIGAIAATLLLAAGGGWWYMLWQGHTAASAAEAIAHPSQEFSSQPRLQVQQQVQQNSVPPSAPEDDNGFVTPNRAGAPPLRKSTAVATPATDVQKIASGHDSSKPAPNSATSRAAEPVSQVAQETRNPAFNKMRLAAP